MYLVCRAAALERRLSDLKCVSPWACRLRFNRQWIALRAWRWLSFVAARLPNLWHGLAWAVPVTGPASASAAAAMRAAQTARTRYGIRSAISLRDSAPRSGLPRREARLEPRIPTSVQRLGRAGI